MLIWLQDKLKCPRMGNWLHYAAAIQWTIIQPLKMFSKTFMVENAHSRMLNGAELNQGWGAPGFIRAGWAGGAQAQPGHRARVVTFRQRQPFPWGEPGRAGPEASPGPCGGRPGRGHPEGRMEEEGGGMEPSGFPIPGRPSAASPAPVTRRPRGDKGPGAARALVRGQRPPGRGAAGGPGRQRWLEGSAAPSSLRTPLFCFVVLSS